MIDRLLLLAVLCCAALSVHAQAPQPLVIGETFVIQSQILHEERQINVYAPPADAASPDVRLPVLYMPDGGIAEDFLHVAGLVQVLTGNGTMRPFLLVGTENTERRRDLTGPTENAEDKKVAVRVGGSANFRAFLRNELIPAIEKRYRTTSERASSVNRWRDCSLWRRCCSSPRCSIRTSPSTRASGGTMGSS